MIYLPEILSSIEDPTGFLLESIKSALLIDDVSGLVSLLDGMDDTSSTSLAEKLESDPGFRDKVFAGIKTVTFNEAAVELFEADSIEELSRRAAEIAPPESLSSLAAYLQAIAGRDPRFSDDVAFVTLKGKRIYVRANVNIFENGDKTFAVNSFTNITDWYNDQNALAAVRTRYALALKGSQFGVWDFDILNQQVIRDAEYHRILGYGEGELDSSVMGVRALMHPEDLSDLGTMEEFPDSFDYEFRVRRKSGEYRWVRLEGSVCEWNAAGEKIRAVGTVRDTTVERQQLELMNLEKEIFKNASDGTSIESLISLVASKIDVAFPALRCLVLMLDDSRRSIRYAAAPSLPEDIRKSLLGFPIMSEPTTCRAAMQSGSFQFMHDAWSSREFSSTAAFCTPVGIKTIGSMPITDSTNTTLGTICLASNDSNCGPPEDLVSLERVARSLALVIERDKQRDRARKRELQIQNQQKFESLGKLASGIAHDFNNLLTVITTNAELCSFNVPADNRVANDNLNQVVYAAEMASSLCKQMLTFAGQSKSQTQHVDLAQAATKVASLVGSATKKGIHIDLHIAPGTPNVWGDVTALSQVLLNLLTNAVEAIGESGEVQIDVATKQVDQAEIDGFVFGGKIQPGEHVYVTVKDNGAGISPETLRYVFDPFFTTKSTGQGVGLATVLGIVEQHGGAIDLQSSVGSGTEFTILFPALAELQPAAEKSVSN
ncbi:multi-sensor hybrid histidine kinase [Rhodopirellula maiorica SM1]|uniref:histidine kinase n=1 Tax=Rhodopirellula maiorica SM1 TaxID=1265738 RepID=M5RTK1_9BACT|nr:ATP-binding protein [Rhodopirellula maiorica]EMI18712.1 multi-sensor hybrid histidine kinase [Rhodopirellula maiorica SM1]